MSQSEVQRLLLEIDLQYQAAQRALSGQAQGISTHRFINARFDRMESARARLVDIVGEDKAARLIVDQMDRS
jgi:hypothetical protein